MSLSDCYQILGLKIGASLDEVKSAYRRLARQYHPDINPDAQSQEKFIAIATAYQSLMELAQSTGGQMPTSDPNTWNTYAAIFNSKKTAAPRPPSPAPAQPPGERPSVKVKVQVRQAATPSPVVTLSSEEVDLKHSGFQQLQDLFKQRRYPRAVVLAEGLAQRIPQDPEVRQWQAIAYQQLGRHLISQKQFDKARIYLKKSLKTDPHNRSLWAEVENDFRYLEKLF